MIDIFLEYLPESSDKKNIIGFFGDSMQSIYGNRVGDLQDYIQKGLVIEILKGDNWRCSETVIKLLNKIRTDTIEQERERRRDEIDKDFSGSVKFIYSNADEINIEDIKGHEIFKNWNFNIVTETKELYLTHSLIADKAGFGKLYKIYNNDEIIKHVKKINKKLKSEDRKDDNKDNTFYEVLNMGVVNQAKNFISFISDNAKLYENTKSTLFGQLTKIYLKSDQLIGDNRDQLFSHLRKNLCCYYINTPHYKYRAPLQPPYPEPM